MAAQMAALQKELADLRAAQVASRAEVSAVEGVRVCLGFFIVHAVCTLYTLRPGHLLSFVLCR